jgi:hypothetical protein
MEIVEEKKNKDGTVTWILEVNDEEEKMINELAALTNTTPDQAIVQALEWYLETNKEKE